MITLLITTVVWRAYGQAPFQLALSPEELVGGVASWWETSPRGWFGPYPAGLGQGQSLGGLMQTFWVGAGHEDSLFSAYVIAALHQISDLPQTTVPDPSQPPSSTNRPIQEGVFQVGYMLMQVGVFRHVWGTVFKGLGIFGPDVRAYGVGMDLVWRQSTPLGRVGLGIENLLPLTVRWGDVYEITRPNVLAGLQTPPWKNARLSLAVRAFTDDQASGSTVAIGGYGVDVSFLLVWTGQRWPLSLLLGADRWNPAIGGIWRWGQIRLSLAYQLQLDLGGSFRWAFLYHL